MDINGFERGRRFYDDKYFPVGFARCGEFTLQQANMLESYGYSLKQLESGEKEAATSQEKSFVAVCQGLQAADSALEKVWLKYRQLTKRVNVISPFGSSRIVEEAVTISDDDVDDED